MDDHQIQMEDYQIKMENIEIKEEVNLCDELGMETFEEEAPFQGEVIPKRVTSYPPQLYLSYQFEKPPMPYTCLIYMALKNSLNGSLAVPEIYSFISYNFPYFRTASKNWKSAVRHSLSMNRYFYKVNDSQKYNKWTVNVDKKKVLDKNLEMNVLGKGVQIRKCMIFPEKLLALKNGECLFKIDDSVRKKDLNEPKIIRRKRLPKKKSSQNTLSDIFTNDKNNILFEEVKVKSKVTSKDYLVKVVVEFSDDEDNFFETYNKEKCDEINDSFQKHTAPKKNKKSKSKEKVRSKSSQIMESNDCVKVSPETDGEVNDEKDEYNFVILEPDDNDSRPGMTEESEIVGDDVINDTFPASRDSIDSQDVIVVNDGLKDSGPKELFPRKQCLKGHKPTYLYKYMVMMAFRNSSSKQLSLKQIFNYMYENFSYFNTSKTSYWKRQVQRVLSMESCFQRIFVGGGVDGKRQMVWVFNGDPEENEPIEELMIDDQSSVVEHIPFLSKKNAVPLSSHFPDELKSKKTKRSKRLDELEDMESLSEGFYGFPLENEELDVNDSAQINSDCDNDMDFIEEDLENAEIQDVDKSIDSVVGDNYHNENKTLLNVITRLKNSLSKRNTNQMSKFAELSIFNDKFYKTSILDNHVIKANMKCTKCYETFTDFDSLKAHLLNHSVVKATKCIECNKSFARYSDLKSHMLTAHDDLNQYTCTVCNESFNDLNVLKMHVKSHKSMHKCTMCNKIFSRLFDLKVHILNHANVKVFSCLVCDKVFVKRELLNVHLESHNT